ncbi:MAG: hypothetical protein GTO46_15380 [Gemmatimonadetes bacterium]|nr:hypothetical protein [Gemmatimonadota bacterium]NIO33019.1 hypothetical protein [Gemmatimonadota bacterium]
MKRAVTLLLASVVLLLLPESASAQRFGGEFGGGGGFWLVYADLGIDVDRSFGHDVGGVVTLGGRGFLQTGKVRLGGGAFGGGFVDEGLNSAGNRVQGGFSAGGFTAEYLIVQQNLELVIGGMAGGGVLTIEEIVIVSGGVEDLRRRRESMFVGYPWVRVGYNPAPFINVGLQLGYVAGTQDVGGFAIGLDVMAGLIP